MNDDLSPLLPRVPFASSSSYYFRALKFEITTKTQKLAIAVKSKSCLKIAVKMAKGPIIHTSSFIMIHHLLSRDHHTS
jgi:hypothetical protein